MARSNFGQQRHHVHVSSLWQPPPSLLENISWSYICKKNNGSGRRMHWEALKGSISSQWIWHREGLEQWFVWRSNTDHGDSEIRQEMWCFVLTMLFFVVDYWGQLVGQPVIQTFNEKRLTFSSWVLQQDQWISCLTKGQLTTEQVLHSAWLFHWHTIICPPPAHRYRK